MSNMQVLEVIYTPKSPGRIQVRFLGSINGMLTHRHPKAKRSIPCPGRDACEDHFAPRWKGYAFVEMWSREDRLWYPRAFELCPSAVELTGEENLRGQCWEFWRKTRGNRTKEVTGRLIRNYEPGDLKREIDVKPTVERWYGTDKIEWGISAAVVMKTFAEVSDDPLVLDEKPRVPVTVPAETEREWQEAKKRLTSGIFNGRKK